MRTITAALCGILLPPALPTLPQSQDADEPALPGRVLCFQVEALLMRVQERADELMGPTARRSERGFDSGTGTTSTGCASRLCRADYGTKRDQESANR